jgi:outer membrane protein OmpA-like peptidoglycan-associated protein
MAVSEPFEPSEAIEPSGIDNRQEHLEAYKKDIPPEITIKPEPVEQVQLNEMPEVATKLAEEEKKDIPGNNLALSDLEVTIAFGRNSDVVVTGFDSAIVKIADALLNNSRAVVKVTGHSDSIGAESYNLDLSIRRAYSVKNLLVQRGVDSSRIEIMGLGHLRPVASNNTESGRKRNRRVEMKIAFPGM